MLPAVVTFLSALLLFMVQLLMGKLLLPWFGGTPAVWSTCMLLFQVLLLAGYAYAHGLTRLPERVQGKLHAALLGLALVLLGVAWWRWGSPLIPDDSWKPIGNDAPQTQILTLLLVSIGLPFFLLSTTSPLIQHWQGRQSPDGKIWRLYAISNFGSLLGLLGYPFLFERFLAIPVQAGAWSAAFAVFAVGAAVVALRARGHSHGPACDPLPAGDAPRPSLFTLLVWLILPLTTSAMLLAVTNELCQEIAAVPFLWMLPLALYLLSFIICFDRPAWYHRRFFLAAGAAATVIVLITSSLGLQLKIPVHVASFGGFLFLFCMIGHGELVRLRPATSRLTLFYLMVALGGALGGIFVSLVAPLVFDIFWEFNIMATAAWVVLGILLLREKDSLFHRGDWWQFMLFVWFLSYLGIRLGTDMMASRHIWAGSSLPQHAVLALAAAYTICAPFRNTRFARSKYWPRIAVVTVIFLAECFMLWRIRSDRVGAMVTERNFYGTLQVSKVPAQNDQTPARIQLTHGNINHGYQYTDDSLSRLPVSYYGDTSGINTAVHRHPRRLAVPPKPLRIGVLGLGAGTMAAFGEKGDLVRFYEINPAVIRYSTEANPIFTYLADSRATTEIVTGDARLSLERELNSGHPGQFDLLVMDAFSSDSVPVHLLTREAFALYRKHLRDDESILAANISNRFLDFRDLVGSQARELDMLPLSFLTTGHTVTHSPSSWMILSRSLPFLHDPEVHQHGFPWIPKREVIWTDSFSNLFQILRW
jgi:hypothetical protein